LEILVLLIRCEFRTSGLQAASADAKPKSVPREIRGELAIEVLGVNSEEVRDAEKGTQMSSEVGLL